MMNVKVSRREFFLWLLSSLAWILFKHFFYFAHTTRVFSTKFSMFRHPIIILRFLSNKFPSHSFGKVHDIFLLFFIIFFHSKCASTSQTSNYFPHRPWLKREKKKSWKNLFKDGLSKLFRAKIAFYASVADLSFFFQPIVVSTEYFPASKIYHSTK